MARAAAAVVLCVVGCDRGTPPPSAGNEPPPQQLVRGAAAERDAQVADDSALADGQAPSLASVAAAAALRRPRPGTDWERLGDLVGPVRKVTTRATTGTGEERSTREEIIEFTQYGQRARSWYDGVLYESAKLNKAGDVVERVTEKQGALPRTTKNNSFDDAHRILEQRITVAATGRVPPSDQVFAYRYDANGRVLSVVRTHVGREPGSPTTYTYDDEGDWITRADEDGTQERTLVEVDATHKTLATSATPSIVIREVIDRSSGRLVSRTSAGGIIENVYSDIDDHGNWTKLTTRERKNSGETEWMTDVVRTLEYFDSTP